MTGISALLLLKFCHVAFSCLSQLHVKDTMVAYAYSINATIEFQGCLKVQRIPLRGVLAKEGAVHWQRNEGGSAHTVITISHASQLPANNRRTSPSTYLLAAVTSS